MNKSKAFDEYVAKKCEEILEHNEEYQQLNSQILEAEKKIKAKFTDDIKDFLEYERLIIEQLTLSNIIIYKSLI